MHNIIAFILAYFIFVFIHEGGHIIMALFFNEYQTFTYNIIGPEVIYNTPIFERTGTKWLLISGFPNILTIFIGYILFSLRDSLIKTPKYIKSIFFYLTVCFLLFDPFNLSLGPFIYGGDIGGVATGIGINQLIIQVPFLVLLLFNRELIIQKLFPAYQINTKHFLFRPLIK